MPGLRECGNRGSDFQGLVGSEENLFLVFLAVHSPAFPQSFAVTIFVTRSASVRSRKTAFVWLCASSLLPRYRCRLRPAFRSARPSDRRSGIRPVRATAAVFPMVWRTTCNFLPSYLCRLSLVPELRTADGSSD